MRLVNSKTLGDAVEFDHVFTLSPDTEHNDNVVFGSDVRATYRDCLDYAPGHDLGHAPPVSIDAEVDEHGDVHVTGDAYLEGSEWSFYSGGYTGQAFVKRNDPCMRLSEYVGGRLAEDMIEDGGTFVVTAVELNVFNDDDPDACYAPDSWVVLRKNDD